MQGATLSNSILVLQNYFSQSRQPLLKGILNIKNYQLVKYSFQIKFTEKGFQDNLKYL